MALAILRVLRGRMFVIPAYLSLFGLDAWLAAMPFPAFTGTNLGEFDT